MYHLFDLVVNHWDTITLIVTNIAALFVDKPKIKRKG